MNDAEIRLQVSVDSSGAEKKIDEIKKKSTKLDEVLKNKKIDLNTDLSKLKISDLKERLTVLKQEIASQKSNVNINTAEAQANIKKLETAMAETKKAIEAKLKSLSQAFKNAGKLLTVGLTVPIAGLITAGIKYNSTVETLTTSFKVMTGSAEEAADIVSQLKEIGAKTPYEFTGLADTVQLLMQYGQTSKQAIEVTKMVGDVSQGSAEKMNSIALAYGQMSSAGKVNLMDVKQMITAGFNPLQIISDKTGKSMASLYDRISKGTMSVQEITDAFTYATSEGGKFYGSSEEQSKTLAGRLSTLKDNFNEATGSLTESLLPALESLVQKLTKVASCFASLDEGQRKTILTILAVVASIGPLLIILSKIITAVTTIASLLTKLGPIFQGVWAVIKVVGVAIGSTFGAIVIAVGSVVGAIIWAIFYIKKNFIAFSTGLNYIFKGILNGLIWVLNKAIGALNIFFAATLLPLNAIIAGLNLLPGVHIGYVSFAIPKIPKLAVGTNYVADDGLAFLHKGEAVVPKKYNPAMGFGGNQTITIEMPDIYMDNEKVGRAVTPVVSRTVRLAGAR